MADFSSGLLKAGSGLATAGAGDVVANLGTQLLGGGFSSLMGDSKANAMDLVRQVADEQEARWKQSQSNAMGQTGQAAVAGVRNAMSQPLNSVSAINSAQDLNDYANRTLSSANQQVNLINSKSDRDAGNVRRDLMSQLRAGGTPSAIGAVSSKLGQGFAGNRMDALNEGLKSYQSSLGQAGGMKSQSSDILNQDKQTTFNTRVAPYMNKMEDLGLGSLAGVASSAYGTNMQMGADQYMNKFQGMTDVLHGSGNQAANVGMWDMLFPTSNPEEKGGNPNGTSSINNFSTWGKTPQKPFDYGGVNKLFGRF